MTSSWWTPSQEITAVSKKLSVVHTTGNPIHLRRSVHVCQVRVIMLATALSLFPSQPTTFVENHAPPPPHPLPPPHPHPLPPPHPHPLPPPHPPPPTPTPTPYPHPPTPHPPTPTPKKKKKTFSYHCSWSRQTPYLKQWWSDSVTHICGTRGRWVKAVTYTQTSTWSTSPHHHHYHYHHHHTHYYH